MQVRVLMNVLKCSVAFIGLGEEIETLLLDVIPGVRVLSFPAPSPSKQGIEAGARNLLQGLHEDPPISAMIHVNSHKKYTELSSIITDLVRKYPPFSQSYSRPDAKMI
ncbi:hypothetical protein N7462_002424 [Penicillium macrosclerotiorum]|uniref:uncharacterized protein n=1 Tax=Penicillium macrosclerotiorum TaxID=303699 RepID=UPI0025482D97|nr:uncharacterized protein N7462_002424 [Penicillium macrosclerotiorum]KAJ5693001.1 hypothetical protein N7462_002424 [Penicillium macrosclerotiorum]